MSAVQQVILAAGAGSGEYTGWTPADGTAPYAWYIGDDPANTSDGSDNLTHLEDKSGNARHIESGNIANIKVVANGIGSRTTLNSVTGDSANERMRIPSSAGMLNGAAGLCVAFVVYRADSGTSSQTLFFAETTSRNTSRAFVAIEGVTDDTPRFVSRRADGDGASWKDAGTTVSTAGYAIVVCGYDVSGQLLRLRVNGTETTQTSYGTAGSTFSATNSYDGVLLLGTNPASGSYESFKGNMGEAVLYNAVVTQADMEKLEGYLAHTWGVTSLLPGGHPYKSTPPAV